MPIVVEIDTSDVRKLLEMVENAPSKINRALRDSVNEVGDGLQEMLVDSLVEETGFTPSAASKFIKVQRATLSDTTYTMVIQQGALEDEVTRRGPTRDFQQRAESVFSQDMLVNVITAQDGKVCAICQEIAREGPYTLAETKRIRETHPHFLNRELRCRCALSPFKPEGRVTPSVKTGKGASLDMPAALKRLAALVAQNTGFALRMK